MGQIIEFPIKHTNGYNNLIQFFDVAETPQECSFYLDSVDYMAANGMLTPDESTELRDIGRQKRISLAMPDKKPPKAVTGSGTYTYYPEMGETKPECQIEASRAYYGKHWFLDTPLELKGRGITLLRTYTSKELTPAGQYKVGWHEYQVTERAFDKIKAQYSVSIESLLD